MEMFSVRVFRLGGLCGTRQLSPSRSTSTRDKPSVGSSADCRNWQAYPDYSGFSHQLKKPFAPTELNCTRWRTVAQLVKFDGEPLQETES